MYSQPASSNDVDQLRLARLSRSEWIALTPSMFGYSFRHSWAYGESVADRYNATSEHIGIFRGADCIGLADVRVRQIPIVGGGIAFITGGPLVRRGHAETIDQDLSDSLETLVSEYVKRRTLVLRIAPPIEWATVGWDVAPLFARLQFVTPGILPGYRTLMVDLTPSVEQLRKNLDSRWNACLSRAEKHQLTLHTGTAKDLLDRFCPLFLELIKRKGFCVELSGEFFRDLQERMDAGEEFRIKLVESEGQLVAGHVASVLGQTSVALLVASNQAGNDLKATHLLHWKTLVEAKESGCSWYDLGGIDPKLAPGVYQFKRLIRGTDVRAHGPFECHPSHIRAQITHFAEKVYRRLRRH
jgi:hypothetical protein